MSLQYTKNDVLRHAVAFFRGKKPDGIITAHENEVINDSVSAAIIKVFSDYNLADWRFNTVERTSTLSAGSNYIDITSEDYEVINVVFNTVSIVSPSINLNCVTKDQINNLDPGYTETGLPQLFAIERPNGDGENANNVRMYIWPVADATYSIKYTLTVAYNNDIETKIPSFVSIPLKTKAIELACRWLGPYELVQFYSSLYQKDLEGYRTNENTNKPKHIPNYHGEL